MVVPVRGSRNDSRRNAYNPSAIHMPETLDVTVGQGNVGRAFATMLKIANTLSIQLNLSQTCNGREGTSWCHGTIDRGFDRTSVLLAVHSKIDRVAASTSLTHFIKVGVSCRCTYYVSCSSIK